MESKATAHVDALWLEMKSQRNDMDVMTLLKRSMASIKTTDRSDGAARKKKQVPLAAMKSCGDQPAASDGRKRDACAEPFVLQRELNRLTDERASVRKRAARALELQFLQETISNQPEDQSNAIVPIRDPSQSPVSPDEQSSDNTIAFSELARPLFKRFNDPVESVREVCIRVATKFLRTEQDLLLHIPYLIPAIVRRISSQYAYDEENQSFSRDQFLQDAFKRGRIYVDVDQVARLKPGEPSEEIRLLFLHLVDALLTNAFEQRASSILHAYIFDLLLVLVASLHDDFHEVNIQACRLLTMLSHHMVSVLKHFSVALVRTMKDLLLHRLARVRMAAIEAIQALVSCPNFEKCKGSGTEAIVDLLGHRDENVIPVAAFYTTEVRLNYFAKLDQDPNVLVRSAFFAMIGDWLQHLPDRFDHESRLMPYLLSAVSDENDNIAQQALKTLAFLGQRFEEEQGEEVLEFKQYGMDGRNPSYNYTKQLPKPFDKERPSLGARLYVRGRARRFLAPILRELGNWQSKTRAHAVRLLKSVLVFSEETITVDAHSILNTLLSLWREPEIATDLCEIADLTGRFTAPDTYMKLVLARIRGESEVTSVVTPDSTAVATELLFWLMAGSLDKALLPHVHDVLDALAIKHILDFEHAALKQAVGRLTLQVAQLIQRRGQDALTAHFLQHGRLTSMESLYNRLFEIAIVLQRSACAKAAQDASSVLEILAALETLKSVGQLCGVHSPMLCDRIVPQLCRMSAVQWNPTCYEQAALEQILRSTSASVLFVSPVASLLDELFRHMLAAQEEPETAETCKEKESKRSTRAQVYERELQTLLMRFAREQLHNAEETQRYSAWQTLLLDSAAAA